MSAMPLYEINNPAGYWRCTHSTFSRFVVGKDYPCLRSPSGGFRIYPEFVKHGWSPYWVSERARFCYGPDMLDFVFIRPFEGAEQAELERTRDEAPSPDLSHIHFPLRFEENDPQPAPRRRVSGLRLPRIGARDAAIFAAGAAAAALACLTT